LHLSFTMKDDDAQYLVLGRDISNESNVTHYTRLHRHSHDPEMSSGSKSLFPLLHHEALDVLDAYSERALLYINERSRAEHTTATALLRAMIDYAWYINTHPSSLSVIPFSGWYSGPAFASQAMARESIDACGTWKLTFDKPDSWCVLYVA
jgi:hypothetical protein